MESIIAAIISAIGSIVAALISRRSESNESTRVSRDFLVSTRPWWIYMTIFIPILTAGSFANWDIAEFGAVFVLISSIVMSFVTPIPPWTAAAFVLALHPVALLLLVVAKQVHHILHVYWESTLVIHLGFLLFNAVVVGLICKWKLTKT